MCTTKRYHRARSISGMSPEERARVLEAKSKVPLPEKCECGSGMISRKDGSNVFASCNKCLRVYRLAGPPRPKSLSEILDPKSYRWQLQKTSAFEAIIQ